MSQSPQQQIEAIVRSLEEKGLPARAYILAGSLKATCHLEPTQYRATI